jgi:hypothetical protein
MEKVRSIAMGASSLAFVLRELRRAYSRGMVFEQGERREAAAAGGNARRRAAELFPFRGGCK